MYDLSWQDGLVPIYGILTTQWKLKQKKMHHFVWDGLSFYYGAHISQHTRHGYKLQWLHSQWFRWQVLYSDGRWRLYTGSRSLGKFLWRPCFMPGCPAKHDLSQPWPLPLSKPYLTKLHFSEASANSGGDKWVCLITVQQTVCHEVLDLTSQAARRLTGPCLLSWYIKDIHHQHPWQSWVIGRCLGNMRPVGPVMCTWTRTYRWVTRNFHIDVTACGKVHISCRLTKRTSSNVQKSPLTCGCIQAKCCWQRAPRVQEGKTGIPTVTQQQRCCHQEKRSSWRMHNTFQNLWQNI